MLSKWYYLKKRWLNFINFSGLMGNKTKTSMLSMTNFVSKECIPCQLGVRAGTWRSRLLACSVNTGAWENVAERRLELLTHSLCDPSDLWRAERGEHSSPHLCFPLLRSLQSYSQKHCQSSSHFRHSELLALSLCLTCLQQQPHYCCEDTEFSLLPLLI